MGHDLLPDPPFWSPQILFHKSSLPFLRGLPLHLHIPCLPILLRNFFIDLMLDQKVRDFVRFCPDDGKMGRGKLIFRIDV